MKIFRRELALILLMRMSASTSTSNAFVARSSRAARAAKAVTGTGMDTASPTAGPTAVLSSISSSSCNDIQTTNHNGAAAVSTKTSSTLSSSSNKSPTFDKFDYEDHWYPTIWEEDLEMEVPTKVTVFDVDYVVAKTPAGDVVAMKDYCTHKGAALSEGRVTASGNFQCAYHGWSFDGKTGDCVEIPQIVFEVNEGGERKSATIPKRACSKAVPAQIHQGMVWLFPGGGLEKALLAPPPPSVPDKLWSKFKLSTVVRDMPIDFSILLSNICDPDHGLFAHQSTNFDMYTASMDCGFDTFVSEETDEGRGWSLRTRIDSKDKLQDVDRSLRASLDPKPKKKFSKSEKDAAAAPETPWATFRFHAPTFVRMNRVDKTTSDVKFVSVFYVCPVGVGRSRFMAGSLSAFKIPRWLNHVSIANFLDQDTYLLATQQGKLLAKEADDLRSAMEEAKIDRDDTDSIKSIKLKTRTKSFVLPSPTDKISARMEQFWDATLARCPNRVRHLLKLDESGTFLQTPSREFVLDRKTQNLDISKDSRGMVRNCKRMKAVSRALLIALALGKIACTSSSSQPIGLLTTIFETSFVLPALTGLSLISFLAGKLEKEYYFKYTDDFRRSDMKKIPLKIWLDK